MGVDEASANNSDSSVSPGRLREVEESIAALTDAQKLELIARIAGSIRVEPEDPRVTAERAERQRLNRDRLRARLTTLPAVEHDDGFSNREHDEILYGTPS